MCNERRGERIRKVTEVKATLMIERYLAARIPADASPMKSISHIYSKGTRIFLVDDVGMLMKGVLEVNGMCDVHISFWDRVLVGRESMCNHMARLVASDAGMRGSWTAIPLASAATLAFAKRCGFEEFFRSDSVSGLALLVT